VKNISVAFVVLVSASTLAQTAPDFSGIFVRTELIDGHKHRVVAPPRILEVRQALGEITITVTQNRETAEVHASLDGKKSNHIWAYLKGDVLVLKNSTMQPGQTPDILTPVTMEEKWMLSSESRQLTVQRKYVVAQLLPDWTETETYARQSSMEAARSIADSAANRCNQLSDFLSDAESRGKVKKKEYNEGVWLGDTELQRLTRCVLYTADLPDKFFKDLKRSGPSSQIEFSKSGEPVFALTEDVVLEIEPIANICSMVGVWSQKKTESMEEVHDLRFMVRWMGKEVKDPGEVASVFRYEHWMELEPSRAFYRIRISAKDVPLSDELELTIFTKSGEELGCIRGHM
jgi:hypothetical protein